MDGISSTPIENSVDFLRLRDKYKSDLFEDTRLNKAAGLAAKQELLLESPAPDTWKEPRLKAVNRELQQWVKKIRQPGGTRGITRDHDDSDDEDDNLAVAPIHKMMGHISKFRQGIKRKAEPVTPLLQTPVIKQPPSTGKKPKVSYKTGSKGKKWVPKTLKKSFQKANHPPPYHRVCLIQPRKRIHLAQPTEGFHLHQSLVHPTEGFHPTMGFALVQPRQRFPLVQEMMVSLKGKEKGIRMQHPFQNH